MSDSIKTEATSQDAWDLNNLVGSVRDLQKSVESGSSDAKSTVSKMEAKVGELESKMEKAYLAKEAKDKEYSELQERLVVMEKQAFRPGGIVSTELANASELKAFDSFLKSGKNSMTPDEVKTLRTDDDPQGGFLAPNEYLNELIRNIVEITPFMSLARIINTNRKALEVPRRTGEPNSFWVGETEVKPSSQSSYGLEEIPVNKLGVKVQVSREMMSDSVFNMSQEIRFDIAEEFARAVGNAFVVGDSVKKPQGFVNNPNVEQVATGDAADITMDGIIDLQGSLKRGYNGSFIMNRRTAAAVKKLKDGSGQYLWQPNQVVGQPATLQGDAVITDAIDMPDIAPGAFPIAYGDWRRGYYIAQGMQLEIIRDDFTNLDQCIVNFVAYQRVGGQVVLPEAIKLNVVSV